MQQIRDAGEFSEDQSQSLDTVLQRLKSLTPDLKRLGLSISF